MSQVTSKDGTKIAYSRQGAGPPVILVGGTFQHRAMDPRGERLAALLGDRLTVITYDRRGRGESGDTRPYAVEREIDDLDALIAEAGGAAAVFGMSSGAALGLAAVAGGLPITRFAAYEPPFIVDDTRPRVPADLARHLADLSADRPADAVELFLTVAANVPAEFVTQMRSTPFWPWLVAAAHTVSYDVTILGDFGMPAERAAAVDIPTLVIDGAASPAWMRNAATALATAIPHAQHRTLDGQAHDVSPDLLAPALLEFLTP